MWWACDEDLLQDLLWGKMLYTNIWVADARSLCHQMKILLDCPLRITAHSAQHECEVDDINTLIQGHKLALVTFDITKEIRNQSRVFPRRNRDKCAQTSDLSHPIPIPIPIPISFPIPIPDCNSATHFFILSSTWVLSR